MMRHVLDIDDFTPAELEQVLDLSTSVETGSPLAGKAVALLFEKPSARTRNSMEVAVTQLGGHPAYIRPDEVGLDERESVEDVTRTFACYYDMIGARVFDHSTVERMASVDAAPIINLLSDAAHPMQVLGDLLTMRDELSVLEDRTVAFIGDGNNVAASLALGTALTGMRFIHAAPHGYDLSHEVVKKVGELGGSIEVYRSAYEAVEGADVVYTDTWASMGEEAMAAEKELAFADFQVDEQIMALAGEKAIFLHCLPAKRGKEVIDPVIDGPQSRVWQQAENRMHSARGLLAWLSQWHQKPGHQEPGSQEQT